MATNHSKKSLVAECPQCGVKVAFPALTNKVHTKFNDDLSTDESGALALCIADFGASICVSCNQPVLIGTMWDDLTEETYVFTYPRYVKKASRDLPEKIRRDLNEIYRCESVWAYAATAVMCRRLIERCCHYFECTEQPLKKQIDVLLTNKFPNETLKHQAHLIRSIGNEGAHALEEVSWSDAEALVAFCEEFTHHLFITQRKLQEIIKRREDAKKKKKGTTKQEMISDSQASVPDEDSSNL